MVELFKMEVFEIYEGVIIIKVVVCDLGLCVKIVVLLNDGLIDLVGVCVGMCGSCVQVVVNEFQGEKIDIIFWNEDMLIFFVNVLQFVEVFKVVLDEEVGKIEVVVLEE